MAPSDRIHEARAKITTAKLRARVDEQMALQDSDLDAVLRAVLEERAEKYGVE